MDTIKGLECSKCSGCKMCGDICPVNAIFFEVDNDGFWFPQIKENLCINCGLCAKKCPIISPIISKNNDNPEIFAAWSKDDKVRYDSTSGGIYFEIAKEFLREGGYISGCVFSEDYKSAYHIVGNTEQDLRRIMGSKYFQSDTEGIYSSVKDLLDKDKKVLFCGTPCQIAAIKSFLSKDYSNFYTIDFICKGINSPKAYRAYIEELERKYHSKIKVVRQKSKKTGWQSLATNIQFQNGVEYHKDRYSDWWIQGYTCGNLFMRENCQQCLYKGISRQADISLGDFWKIQNCSDSDLYKGVSVVFVNSEKGRYLFNTVSNMVYSEHRNIDEVLDGNPYLFGQAVQKGDRRRFFELLDSVSFSKAVRMTYTETLKQKTKRYIKLVLKKCGRKKW